MELLLGYFYGEARYTCDSVDCCPRCGSIRPVSGAQRQSDMENRAKTTSLSATASLYARASAMCQLCLLGLAIIGDLSLCSFVQFDGGAYLCNPAASVSICFCCCATVVLSWAIVLSCSSTLGCSFRNSFSSIAF